MPEPAPRFRLRPAPEAGDRRGTRQAAQGSHIDTTTITALLVRGWSFFVSIPTVLLVATCLSSQQQGFYYAFASLLALQLLVELGLSGVLATFVSHERAQLGWSQKGDPHGDPRTQARLADLVAKAVLWYGVAAALYALGVVPAGIWLFSLRTREATDFAWRLPWILAVAASAISLLATPLLATTLGAGDVAGYNRCDLAGRMAGAIVGWSVLLMGGGLFAVPAMSGATALVNIAFVVALRPGLLRLVRRGLSALRRPSQSDHNRVSWRREVLPMQWRIAASWVCGYFIFQLFTPVLFRYHGPVAAGQMGMTLAAATSLSAAALVFVEVKLPEMGRLVARGDWRSLDQVFFRTLPATVGLSIAGALGGAGGVWLLQLSTPLGSRLLPAPQALVLFCSSAVVVVVGALASYLRAHKREPFLPVSIGTALLQMAVAWWGGRLHGSLGFVSGFLAVQLLFALPTGIAVWRHKRREWHAPPQTGVQEMDQ